MYSVAPSGMPAVRTARLRCVHDLQISAQTNNGLIAQAFTANSPFKPVGEPVASFHVQNPHQPMGYDQWERLYNQYVVKGSKITIAVTGANYKNEVNSLPPTSVGVYLSGDPLPTYTQSTSYREAKKGTCKLMALDQRYTTYLTGYYSPRRFFAVKDIKDNFDRLGASVTASPEDLAHFVFWLECEDGNEELPFNQQLRATVTIDYIVEFSDPKNLAPSSSFT